MDPFFAILLVLLLGGIAALVAHVQGQKRREALQATTWRLGLDFDPGADRSMHRAFSHSFFNRGRSRQATNTMFGVLTLAGYPIKVRMGDYQYVTGSGKNRRIHRHSYACLRLPFFGTPDLLIRKENLGDRLAGGLGFDDIDFESEEFSRAFWVKSGDKRYAYDVIHPRMMEFLLRGPTPQIEIVQDTCLIRQGWGRWDPSTFEGSVQWFESFLQQWPEHLVDQLQLREGMSE